MPARRSPFDTPGPLPKRARSQRDAFLDAAEAGERGHDPGEESAGVSLVPVPRRPGWIALRVGGQRVATLPEHAAKSLHLHPGDAWTDALAGRVWKAEAEALATQDAGRLLLRGAGSEARVRERLTKRGHSARAIDSAMELLRRAKVLDDQRAAASLATSHARDQGEESVRAALEAKGFTPALASKAARNAARERDEVQAAERAIRPRLGTLKKLPPPKAAMRLLAMLARRGFEEQSARKAVERALGKRALDALSSLDAPEDPGTGLRSSGDD